VILAERGRLHQRNANVS